MKALKIALAVLLAAAALVYFFSGFKLENVEVKNSGYYSETEIKDFLFTGKTDAYTVLFMARMKIAGAPEIPFIEKFDFEMTDKNSLVIYVYEKAVSGCVEQMGKYFHFDKDGIVVECTDSVREGLPIIRGLDFDNLVLNQKLPVKNQKVFRTILELTMLFDKNGLDIDELCFFDRNEVTLYAGGNEILLGKADSYDFKVNNLKEIISSVGDEKYSFDMRNYNENNMTVTARPLE